MLAMKLTPYGIDALERGFREAPQVAQREMLAAMNEAMALLEADVVGNFPKHTGLTRGSIASDAFATPTGVLGVVGSPAPVALFIELGTRPHTPPLAPLVDWVADILGKTGGEGFVAARGIQRKIAQRGTPAREPFGNSLRQQWARIGQIFESAAGRIAAQLPGGAA